MTVYNLITVIYSIYCLVNLDNFFDVGMFGFGLVCGTRIWNILGIV